MDAWENAPPENISRSCIRPLPAVKLCKRVEVIGMDAGKHDKTSHSVYEYQKECYKKSLAKLFDCPNVFKV